MKQTSTIWALLAFCLLAMGDAKAQAAPPPDSVVIAGAHAYLSSLETQGFSGVVLVQRHGKRLLYKGYGFSDCARMRPMSPDMVFDIGSITKVITAAAILDLVATGKVSLSDTLGKYFPAVPLDKTTITVDELLRHTSGLPDALGNDEDFVTKAWIVEHALASPLSARPGETKGYSNVGYSLLGAIIEQVSGSTYEEYVTRRLLVPAGLTRTGYLRPKWAPSELACGLRDGTRWGATRDYFGPDGPSWHLRANGGMLSTAEELARWFDAFLSGRLLPPEVTAIYKEAVVRSSGSTKYIEASGSNIIFTAEYLKFLESDLTVVLLTSDSRWPKERISAELVRHLRPLYLTASPP
jgi:CubicO group peptidase (beta-lactamase class C family)